MTQAASWDAASSPNYHEVALGGLPKVSKFSRPSDVIADAYAWTSCGGGTVAPDNVTCLAEEKEQCDRCICDLQCLSGICKHGFCRDSAIYPIDENCIPSDQKAREMTPTIVDRTAPHATRGLADGNDYFGSDTGLMKLSDNMFDSYVGAKGSTIFDANASGKPLNLTMAFP